MSEPLDLAAIRARLERTGYNPWKDDTFALLDEVERLRAERDRAREEVGHEKAMRQFVSEERDMFIDRMKCAEAEADRWKAAWKIVRAMPSGQDQAASLVQDLRTERILHQAEEGR